MRKRTAFPLLFSAVFLLLAALLLVWGSPPSPTFAAGVAWTDLAGPQGGPAQAVAVNPDYPADQTVFAGGGHDLFYASWKGKGIFRSTDGGATWDAPGGPADGALLDVAFSPRWHDDGFAAAGLWQGIWLTHDRGATWQQVAGLDMGGPWPVNAIAISSPAPGVYTLLAGGAWGGLDRSTDGGVTWTSLLDAGGVARLVIDPQAPAVAWAATGTGLWRSDDAGLQWTQVITAPANDVLVGPSGGLYAIFDEHAWFSADGGSTWQPIVSPPGQKMQRLGAGADGQGLFAASGPHLYRYEPLGDSFVTVTTFIPATSIEQIAVSPHFGTDGTVWVGDHNGVWRSQDGGETFVRSAGFAAFELRDVAAAGGSEGGDLFVAGDEGVWRLHAGSWQPANAGLVGQAATVSLGLAVSPAYAEDQTLFAVNALANGLGASLMRSNNSGDSWERLPPSFEYISQVAISPDFAADRRIFLVASQAVWRSDDGGDTWAKAPFWDSTSQASRLAVSPGFAADHTLLATGNGLYRSTDAGNTWQPVADGPPVTEYSSQGWAPSAMHWGASGRLYLALHNCSGSGGCRYGVWVGTDGGASWIQLAEAPALPVHAIATGPTEGGSGEAVYFSTAASRDAEDVVIPPDLYVSRDGGATWQNLGAIPGGAAKLATAADAPDRLWAANYGVKRLDASVAPTATPNLTRELLANRSFEYQGVWRIPDTRYDAGYSQDQHYAGNWSMRTGIVTATVNVHSFSDFSQDVTLPATGTVTLRLHRWTLVGAAGTSAADGASGTAEQAISLPEVATLDDFYRLLDTRAGDLQYVLLIEQPGGTIHYLAAGLANGRTWEEKTFDLNAYLGKQVRLQFGTYNDGAGLTAAQYFDVMELQATAPLQPTATPTVDPTALPAGTPQAWLPYLGTGRAR